MPAIYDFGPYKEAHFLVLQDGAFQSLGFSFDLQLLELPL